MRTIIKEVDHFLKQKGIKASYQRLRIFDYLQKSTSHPTVSMIYTDLHPEIPSLSRATVYNTLNLFVDKKIAKVLPLEDHEARFDIASDTHAHFRCLKCNQIYDIPQDDFTLELNNMDHYEAMEAEVLFKGICEHCHN